jgi:hypothetical protein
MYGHVSSHPKRHSILIDGLIDSERFYALHLDDRDQAQQPQIELLGQHSTEWGSVPGQMAHPHPHLSPDGRWLAYNCARNQRSDVHLLDLHS